MAFLAGVVVGIIFVAAFHYWAFHSQRGEQR
jgi:hypothetical protein